MRLNRILAATWRRPFAGVRDVAYGDVFLAALASVLAIGLVSGLLDDTDKHTGVWASIAVLPMTVPLAWRRRAPFFAAAVLGAGAVFNALAVGRMVRCGPALPALFIVAFALGHQLRGRRLWIGYAALLVSAVSQTLSDPNLQFSLNIVLVPLIAGFLGAGRLLASRQAMVSALRARNEELRDQRETNARLAVAADRARIAESLDDSLRGRIEQMSQAAARGQEEGGEAVTRAVFAEVEQVGRDALSHMREVVGALRPTDPNTPAPVLAQLDELLAKATTSETRLVVTGTPESLPAGVELSGYRIVEHLLVALEDAPDARVDVTVNFTPEALEITVRGPAAKRADRSTALAAARQRVALHGGTLAATTTSGRCEAVARLPLAPIHA